MIVRRASELEIPAIRLCVEASLQSAYGGLWTSEPLAAADRNWAYAWVSCADDEIVGVGLSEQDVVRDLWVHPSWQGRGAGTALLSALEAEIAGRGFVTARLRCLEPNHR